MSEQAGQERSPALLLDAMLGRLTRWLRLMGYNAAYLSDTDDLAVVALARAESRIILTRDRGLAGRRGIRSILIESQQIDEQIAQVRAEIGPPMEPVKPRCGACNTPLEPLDREAAVNRVPPYIWRTHSLFTHCAGCHRVYWPGTHWQAIQRQISGDEASV